jgi:hypothetical protein
VRRLVLLDAGVVGLLFSSPGLASVSLGLAWMRRLIAADVVVTITNLTDYEVRRELIRLKATRKLFLLDSLQPSVLAAEVTPEAWLKAAEFWAIVRSTGKPTADPHALDGDAILAGVAATIGVPGDSVTIATTNVGHLSRFPGVDARRWETIS